MFQNLVWATGTISFVIPFDAGALISSWILLTSAIGGALISANMVIVSVNAGA